MNTLPTHLHAAHSYAREAGELDSLHSRGYAMAAAWLGSEWAHEAPSLCFATLAGLFQELGDLLAVEAREAKYLASLAPSAHASCFL